MNDQLSALGMEMNKRRVELLKPHAGEIAISAARSFPAGAAVGAVLLTASAVAIGTLWATRRRVSPRRQLWRG